MTVEFGLSLSAHSPKQDFHNWLNNIEIFVPQFEGHFKSLWMTDHFMWDDEPTMEAWTTIAYMAAMFPTFDIGPIVLGQNYRNPALLAKMAATLQVLSNGRFIMAIGAGWKEDEYNAYDYPFPKPVVRIEQLEDTLEILQRLWSEPGQVTYEGKHYSVHNAWCEPKPDPVPPIIVGGGGNKTMLAAAKYADWWNFHDANYEDYSTRVNTLLQHCANIGRDPNTLRLTWFGRLVVARTEDEALRRSNGKWNSSNAFVGTPDQVIEQMRPFVELGVDYFMVEVLGLPDNDVIQMVIQEVLPAVQSFTKK